MLAYLQTIETPEDQSKFEWIYERYLGLMYYVADKILHNRQDAEDAVQQAFVSIAENIKTISDPKSSKTRSYVVLIVENKSIDIIRYRKRFTAAGFEETERGLDFPDEGALDLAALIGRLPAHYREILLLRYDNGYSKREIARLLGITPGNAEKRLYRAKMYLQKLMTEEDRET